MKIKSGTIRAYPFGITPGDMAEFDRKQDEVNVDTRPVRDVAKETFWDFVKDSRAEDCLMPEALALFCEWR